MFRRYGIVGVVMILFAEIALYFRIEPFVAWFYPIVWWGYLLFVDAAVYKLQRNSLIMNRRKLFFGMVIISAFVWFIGWDVIKFFHFPYWTYIVTIPRIVPVLLIFGLVSFGTVLPNLFETADLIKALHLFDHAELHRQKKKRGGVHLSKTFLVSIVVLGVIFFLLLLLFPSTPLSLLGWICFFFMFDPINYMYHQPSIIEYVKQGKFKVPLAVFFSGFVIGFLWEFWNNWAGSKWIYNVPFNLGPKLFELPIFGYLCYGPFALELFAMYYFVRLLSKEVGYLEKKVGKKVEKVFGE